MEKHVSKLCLLCF